MFNDLFKTDMENNKHSMSTVEPAYKGYTTENAMIESAMLMLREASIIHANSFFNQGSSSNVDVHVATFKDIVTKFFQKRIEDIDDELSKKDFHYMNRTLANYARRTGTNLSDVQVEVSPDIDNINTALVDIDRHIQFFNTSLFRIQDTSQGVTNPYEDITNLTPLKPFIFTYQPPERRVGIKIDQFESHLKYSKTLVERIRMIMDRYLSIVMGKNWDKSRITQFSSMTNVFIKKSNDLLWDIMYIHMIMKSVLMQLDAQLITKGENANV